MNMFLFLSAVLAMASCQLGQDNNEQTGAQPLVFHRSHTHLKNQTHLQLAFGSCLNQEEDAPIFDAIKSAQPDLFLMVGQCIRRHLLTRDPHARCANDLSELLASQHLPLHCAVWDDHDYGTNDGAAIGNTKKRRANFLTFGRYRQTTNAVMPHTFSNGYN